MDAEKIGQLIKNIRSKNNLSQQNFANRYGVTYQAVSKWERGINIPDIAILKQICEDYNIALDDLLDAKKIKIKKNNRKNMLFLIILIILLLLILYLIVFRKDDKDFTFKTLSPSCSNFNLYGSIAYNDSKSSIYISNITYCGGDDETRYKKISCVLYESDEKTKTIISKHEYQQKDSISLEKYLQNVNFVVDNYEKSCKIYKDNSLYLEIEATDQNDKITTYRIPLKLEDKCD